LLDVKDPTLSRQSADSRREGLSVLLTGRALLPRNIIFLLLTLISVSD
jgi:hypothetical protein